MASRGTAIDEHPTPETLLAYCDDELPGDEDEIVREHLADCAGCAGLVLELTGDGGTEFAAEELSEVDLERAWRRARPRLAPQGLRRGAWLRPPWPTLLAASVLIVMVPLLYFLGGESADRIRPLRLSPLDASRSPQALTPCAVLGVDSEVWRLALPVRDDPRADATGSGFRLEILTEDRQLVTTRELAGPVGDEFVIDLRRADLDRGRHLLYLVDARPTEPVLIERYCIEVLDG